MKPLSLDIKIIVKTFLAMSILASNVVINAADTEIFYSINVSKPNLLFVLDNSGSMNWALAGENSTVTEDNPSRLSIMTNALTTVLNTQDAKGDYNVNNANIGLMRYGPGFNNRTRTGNDGESWIGEQNFSVNDENIRTHGVSGVAFPISDINSKTTDVLATNNDTYFLPDLSNDDTETVRDYFGRIVNSWNASGGTPIVDALYEAALYYRGEQMHFGQDNPNNRINDGEQEIAVAAHPLTYLNDTTQLLPIEKNYYNRQPDNTALPRNHAIAPRYNSPIESHCQSNYIVLMSDGDPTYYQDGSEIENGPLARYMRGNPGFSTLASSMPECTGTGYRANSGKCGPELTQYLADEDNSSQYDEKQTIKTFSIGFSAGVDEATQNYLKDLATFDDPDTKEGTDSIDDGYFSAQNPAELAAAFTKILSVIGLPDGALASPGYSVNIRSGLEHEKDIYIPVFDRKNASVWSGNIKKFRLVEVGDKRKIQGKNNKDAVDELGGFTDDALDYWSASNNDNPDGVIVENGGLANKIDSPVDRLLLSNLGDNKNLFALENQINPDNFEGLNNSLLGIAVDADNSEDANGNYRKTLAKFIRGWKDGDDSVNGIPRKHMGDMLHSEPVIITYKTGNSDSDREQYLFAATNEGYIHAFDTITGEEEFAFMPKELLKNINSQYLNSGTQQEHKYGIDGSLSFWLKEKTGSINGTLDSAKGEKMYIYFGLRRGGESFYALDVTNIKEPKLAWTISSDDADFSSMGQSWSAPYLARVGMKGSTCDDGKKLDCKEVVIISGGYDEAEDRNLNDGTLRVDNASKAVNATKGNDIIIVGAETGEYVWSLPEDDRNKITNSVPSGARILDTNYNGFIDRLYFADTGGHVWRLDLSEDLSSTSSASSTLVEFASLGDGNTRKFYAEPDVSLMRLNGQQIFAISIGSGYRAHPLDKTITDNFFVLKDTSPYDLLKLEDPGKFGKIEIDDLAPITITATSSNTPAGIDTNDVLFKNTQYRGWKVLLPSTGEKVLSTALVFDGIITFSTLVPETLLAGVNIDTCKAPPTFGRFYAIDISTGKAALDLNESGGDITDADAFVTVSKGEIPGMSQAITNPLEITEVLDKDGAPTGSKSCRHPVDIRIGKKLSQVTGYDTCRLESVYWSDPVTAD